ncbi:MAG: AMP-dependent synthetase/ligase [Chthoniobacterales bacterium]
MDSRIIPQNIAELYRVAAERYGDSPAFCKRLKGGEYEAHSFAEIYEIGVALATTLISLGVQARDLVGLIADNRLDWIYCDCAVLLTGAADVPRGTDATEAEILYILDHSEAEVVFVESLAVLKKIQENRERLKNLKSIVLMDPELEAPEGVFGFEAALAKGRELRAAGDRQVEERLAQIQASDTFTVIYTSGTTGIPKGVQLTHANMVSQIENLPFSMTQEDRLLSILPIWHSYERVFEMVAISFGVPTYYTTLRTIGEDLKKVRPTIMASAPRLWESLYQKILSGVSKASGLKRGLFNAAYFSARRVKLAEAFWGGTTLALEEQSLVGRLPKTLSHAALYTLFYIPYTVLDRVVLAKMREAVGGSLRGTISGGGALQPHVDEFFNFIGIPVLEGYGLTETSPVLAVRTWDRLVIGTVGCPYPNLEVRIVDLDSGAILYPNSEKSHGGRSLRGEIHVKGPQVMKGYYKNQEATDKVLKDAWLNTGDIGMVTFNNCLKIMGRSKETIVLLSGENVEPVPIEGRTIESPFISQCMVVGQDQKFLGVLIVPNEEAFRTAGLEVTGFDDLKKNPKVQEILDAELRKLLSLENGFKPFERPTVWRLIGKNFEVGDELTNTFKLKRHVITARYEKEIESIYR